MRGLQSHTTETAVVDKPAEADEHDHHHGHAH
jgi:chaperonin GroEL